VLLDVHTFVLKLVFVEFEEGIGDKCDERVAHNDEVVSEYLTALSLPFLHESDNSIRLEEQLLDEHFDQDEGHADHIVVANVIHYAIHRPCLEVYHLAFKGKKEVIRNLRILIEQVAKEEYDGNGHVLYMSDLIQAPEKALQFEVERYPAKTSHRTIDVSLCGDGCEDDCKRFICCRQKV